MKKLFFIYGGGIEVMNLFFMFQFRLQTIEQNAFSRTGTTEKQNHFKGFFNAMLKLAICGKGAFELDIVIELYGVYKDIFCRFVPTFH